MRSAFVFSALAVSTASKLNFEFTGAASNIEITRTTADSLDLVCPSGTSNLCEFDDFKTATNSRLAALENQFIELARWPAVKTYNMLECNTGASEDMGGTTVEMCAGSDVWTNDYNGKPQINALYGHQSTCCGGRETGTGDCGPESNGWTSNVASADGGYQTSCIGLTTPGSGVGTYTWDPSALCPDSAGYISRHISFTVGTSGPGAQKWEYTLSGAQAQTIDTFNAGMSKYSSKRVEGLAVQAGQTFSLTTSMEGSRWYDHAYILDAQLTCHKFQFTPAQSGIGGFSRTNAVFGSAMADFDLGCSTRNSNCPEGRTISNQYAGVQFQSTNNVYTGHAHSPGFGACNGPHSGWGNAPMYMVFDTPQSKVGFYYAGGDTSDMSVIVEDVYGVSESYTITNKPDGVPSNSHFFAIEGNANIKKLTISGSSYIIDDARWA